MEGPHVCNYSTAAGEVGSGTSAASGGKHFSALAPTGKSQTANAILDGFSSFRIDVRLYAARDDTGDVKGATEVLESVILTLTTHPTCVVILLSLIHI